MFHRNNCEEIGLDDVLRVTRQNEISDFAERPEKLGGYSVEKSEGGRIFHDDARELRVLQLPVDLDHIHFDLEEGYIPLSHGGRKIGGVDGRDKHKPGLKEILNWLLVQDELKTGNPNKPFNVDILTNRGVIGEVMRAPFETQNEFLIGATLFRGTIYMYKFWADQEIIEGNNQGENRNKSRYAGHRFEDYLSVPKNPDLALPHVYGKWNEYVGVFRASVGSHCLVYAAILNAVKDSSSSSNEEFVEIKTRLVDYGTEQSHKSFCKRKTIHWWSQAAIVGNSEIICGRRTLQNTIRKIERYEVEEIRKISQEFWNSAACYTFLNRFLDFVKKTVTEDDPRLIFKFQWKPPTDRNGHFSSSNVIKCSKTRDEQIRVLPDWFIDEVMKMEYQ